MTLNLKQKIIQEAKALGIDKIGFTSAQPFDYLKKSLQEQKDLGRTTGFEHENIDERVYPHLIFEQPKSIIAIALAYPSRLNQALNQDKEDRRGSFARASWGQDYHDILKDRMNKLIAYIKTQASTATFKPMVDTGELIDVAVAQRAGLGFIGKNGLLITEEFGSYVYLGEIITNIEFEPDTPIPDGCGDCIRCLRACPPKALLGDGRLDGKRCLSYQTQTKGYMPEEYRKKMTHVIYGCDICQMVCPYNQGKDFHLHQEMEPVPSHVQPSLKKMLTLSNKEFKQEFGYMSGSWRGKKPLQRNAIIALANYRDQSALPKLIEIMECDVRPVIRGTAAWAISQIQRDYNELIIECMQAQLEKEDDRETIEEMQKAIDVLKQKKKRG
ncbi:MULTISPECIES: tRNA epoxyqueuosine(34) reductase QueG [unclassified Granulicatella]|uniref:tRNA epoxyqueuosine(34) reductase QueG n=1 Tax=unclassified Granulicatella TaxID=2630493 RepID=UPI001073C530|nr:MULTISPECIES: tRNA epoxyqueuosine(34) reductase QueG [unclassified Granulicatella]MBF0780032.1 tRNA epoxyqueuosine(34) reductase QueG [Granulicatella sp. 19428wC4_WM01]TFU95881.1 tRNA epoxyqueuosine(34) reductase QueG [Granulicatella sp. WM01]